MKKLVWSITKYLLEVFESKASLHEVTECTFNILQVQMHLNHNFVILSFHRMPAYDSNPWSSLFFVIFIVVCMYIFVSIFLAVVYKNYRKHLKVSLYRDVPGKSLCLELTAKFKFSSGYCSGLPHFHWTMICQVISLILTRRVVLNTHILKNWPVRSLTFSIPLPLTTLPFCWLNRRGGKCGNWRIPVQTGAFVRERTWVLPLEMAYTIPKAFYKRLFVESGRKRVGIVGNRKQVDFSGVVAHVRSLKKSTWSKSSSACVWALCREFASTKSDV